MIYSVGCEYGIRALTKLASCVPVGRYCLLRDILEGEDLPQHFVGKIFQTLVREGLLLSAKGRGGGFALQRPPNEITLRMIVRAIDGPHRKKRCFLGFNECRDDVPCQLHNRCDKMHTQIDDLLDRTTLDQLVDVMRQHARRKQRPSAETDRRRDRR